MARTLIGGTMAGSRKVFRIEQRAVERLELAAEAAEADLRHAEIMRELGALRAALAAAPQRSRQVSEPASAGAARLTSELTLIAGALAGVGGREDEGRDATPATAPLNRIEHELNAVVTGSEQATQKILGAAEAIEAAANGLFPTLGGRVEQDLAQDIQDLVIAIYEACNFQDLIGQRIARVMATLRFVEDHIAGVVAEMTTASTAGRRDGPQTLHGPRLDGDSGHAAQDDIDALFAGHT